MKFAGNPETRVGHQVTFNPQTFDANMQSHSETQSPSSQDLRQLGFSSKPKDALDDWTQAADLRERRRIENRVPPRNYRYKIKENRNDLGLVLVSSAGSEKSGAKVSLRTTELSNLDAPDAYADATTWLPGDTMCGQPPVTITDAASPALFPVQTIDQNQPSLLIEPQTPLIATPYNLTTYPFILSDPHSQTIFPAFQEGLYLPECLPAYGTTSFGLDSNYSYANLQPQGQLYHKQVLEIVNTNTISAADPEVSVTQHIQQQDTAHNVQMVSRPKSQCWEHGCNGRSFSTFSNLLRHQREKSGQATKATCLDCGTEFTRTAARNFHQKNGKCKPHPST
ncbi:hypothetical protein MCOR25_010598 [Pyricularia grisea]|nr:hypothetical protein MCOR25_010598 [Pyricularia grisea]